MPHIDIITGDKRHRRWSLEEKQAIVAAAFGPGAKPIEVARRADISTGQLYTWRKELAKSGALVTARSFVNTGTAGFSRVVAVAEPAPSVGELPSPVIEVRIGRNRVRIPASTPPELAAAVLDAMVQR